MDNSNVTQYEQICCLCTEAEEIQQEILQHFHTFHANDIFEVDSCNCQESIQLQKRLINHLFSHSFAEAEIVLKTEEIQYENEENLIEEVLNEDEISYENQNETVKLEIIQLKEDYNSFKKCSYCPMQYKTRNGLQKHLSYEHHPDNQLLCTYYPQCVNRFQCEKKLRIHINRHEADMSFQGGVYVCRICEKVWQTKERLIAHLSTHLMDYECDLCGKKFTKYKFMENHIIQHVKPKKRKDRNDITGKIQCDKCTKMIPKDRMKRHTYLAHSDQYDYVCPEQDCNQKFKYSQSLQLHLDRIHYQTPRYECKLCDKKFYDKSNYRTHMIRHNDPDKYKCDICNERYGSGISLKMHKRRQHEPNLIEYLCPFEGCGKSFKMEVNLNGHIKQVHTKDEILRQCPHCSHTCYKIKNLQKHLWRIHQIKQRDHRVFGKKNS